MVGRDGDLDDDLVTTDFQGLRDVDGWQKGDPLGRSAGDKP